MAQADDPFGSYSSSRDERVEAADLLEECWFYENLLIKRRTRMMSRCYSDPSPSSYFSKEVLAFDSCEKGSSSNGEFSCISPEEVSQERQSNTMKKIKPVRKSLHRNLLRTPSLPPRIGRKAATQEKEGELKMSKLICHPSPTGTNPQPRSRHSESFNNSRHRPPRPRPRKPDLESFTMDGWNEARRRYLYQRKVRKSLKCDLEFEEVQGFKDLGFKFDKEDLSPSVVSILPGLQDKKE